MSPKAPADWHLTWLLVGVALGLFGLLVFEVVAKRYL
jgi:hypothetical protein